MKQVTPVTVANGSIQNASRQWALRDARNAISCAASWTAISPGIQNGNFFHSWDECSVMLNSFDKKQSAKCTASVRGIFTQAQGRSMLSSVSVDFVAWILSRQFACFNSRNSQ